MHHPWLTAGRLGSWSSCKQQLWTMPLFPALGTARVQGFDTEKSVGEIWLLGHPQSIIVLWYTSICDTRYITLKYKLSDCKYK